MEAEWEGRGSTEELHIFRNFVLIDCKLWESISRLHYDEFLSLTSSQQGTVTCDKVSCPTLTCSSPMPMAGQCCPVCPKLCQYEGLSYDDGETFSPPNSPCQECLCRQGRVQCKRSMCPQTLCRHPRREGCCPVCNGGCSFISFTISICFLFFVFCPSIQPSIYGPSTSVSLSLCFSPPPFSSLQTMTESFKKVLVIQQTVGASRITWLTPTSAPLPAPKEKKNNQHTEHKPTEALQRGCSSTLSLGFLKLPSPVSLCIIVEHYKFKCPPKKLGYLAHLICE